jgi:hypothetical protein
MVYFSFVNLLGHGKSKWVAARKQGNHPVTVVAGTHFRLKKTTLKKARSLKRQWKLRPDIRFVVRREGWNRKRWWS